MLGSLWTLPYQPIEKLASERCAWLTNKTPIFYSACCGQVFFNQPIIAISYQFTMRFLKGLVKSIIARCGALSMYTCLSKGHLPILL